MSTKKAGAAGGGILTTIVMLLIAGVWSHNPAVLAQVRDLARNGLPTSQIEDIQLPAIPAIPAPRLPGAAPAPAPSRPAPVPATSSAAVTRATQDLAALPVVTRVRNTACRPGGKFDRTCAFGQAWTDSNTAAMGHNGCDTRNDVLAQQMKGVTYKPGTRGCVVMTGTLNDPYTAKTLAFTKAKASAVQIDHVYPLSAAWDLGAASWAPQQRTKFANDPVLNLMAVDGPTNGAKGDKTPGVWMPPNKAYHCGYAVKFITVTKAYGLKLDRADKPALTAALATCR